jgi:hypothetical protein
MQNRCRLISYFTNIARCKIDVGSNFTIIARCKIDIGLIYNVIFYYYSKMQNRYRAHFIFHTYRVISCCPSKTRAAEAAAAAAALIAAAAALMRSPLHSHACAASHSHACAASH